MQVFGGYGVVKDYEAERFLRDSLILPIYEGTSQIQALMAAKDLLKAVMRSPRTMLAPGGDSPCLSDTHFPGDMGRHYRRAAESSFSSTVGWLMVDVGRPIGARRRRRRSCVVDKLGEADLAYVLLSADG